MEKHFQKFQQSAWNKDFQDALALNNKRDFLQTIDRNLL